MPRKRRLQFEGAIYHITSRGNGRRDIFNDNHDRERLLRRLAESCDSYDVRLYLICLMDNHFHLLAETPKANISRFMQSVLTGYSVYFNLRHNECGHLFQGRYNSVLVKGNQYLLKLSRYIHLNPIHTSRHKDSTVDEKILYLRQYGWSTFRGYIDPVWRWNFVEYQPILSMMEQNHDREEQYRKFIEAGIANTDTEFIEILKSEGGESGESGVRCQKFSRKFLTSDPVAEGTKFLTSDPGEASPADHFRRRSVNISPEVIIHAVAQHFDLNPSELLRRQYGSFARPIAAYLLCKLAGMNQREVAETLEYGTSAAVSAQLKKLRQEVADNQVMATQLYALCGDLTR